MNELSLYHIVKQPSTSISKAPLLLLLHGYGSNEEDLFSFAEELPEEYLIISARAPFPMQPYGNAWYAINFDADENKFSDIPQATSSRDLIATFIDEVIENYAVDPAKITLVGFSQGAILSHAVALSFPEKIQRVVALSGYLNKEILKEGYLKSDLVVKDLMIFEIYLVNIYYTYLLQLHELCSSKVFHFLHLGHSKLHF